jgi:hypothetical protein
MLDSQYRQLNADEQLGFRQQINTGGWVRVSRRFVCPVCEGPDNCQVSADGAVVWCGRRSDLPSFTGKINAGGQFLHRMDRLAGGVWPLPRPTPRKQQREKLPPATVAELLTMYHRGATPTNLAELEQELGVPVPTVARVGWNAGAGCWTLPWWSADGKVVGIAERYPRSHADLPGAKRTARSTSLGLAYLPSLHDADGGGIVWVVEGWSDTLAGESIGLRVLGRPSVSGGLADVADLLEELDPARVVVVGERDQKPDGSWPGLTLGRRFAEGLADRLGRVVEVCLPPADLKDLRAAVLAGHTAETWLAGVEWQEQAGTSVADFSRPGEGPVVGLSEYRRLLAESRVASLDSPGTYFDGSGCGSGKSTADRLAIAKLAAGERALVAVPTHANVAELVEELRAAKINAVGSPDLLVIGQEGPGQVPNCRNVEAATVESYGLAVQSVVCHRCPFGRRRHDASGRETGGDGSCVSGGYLGEQDRWSDASVAVATHARVATQGLAVLSLGRKFVSIHEDALAVLRPEQAISRADVTAAAFVLRRLLDEEGLNRRSEWSEEQEAVLATVADAVDGMDAALEGEGQRTGWLDLPVVMPGLALKIHSLLFRASRHYFGRGSRRLEVNWRGILAAVEGQQCGVVVSDKHGKGGVLGEERTLVVVGENRPGEESTTWLADGTGDLATLRRLVPGLTDATPRARLYHRRRVRQVTTRDVMQSTSAAVAIKVLEGILADNPHWKRVGVIGWQKHGPAVEEFRRAGGLGDRVARWSYFGSGDERASNVWWTGDASGPPCDGLVILGTPRKGEAAIRGHLLRVGLEEAARRPTPLWGPVVWQGLVEDGSVRRVNGKGYIADREWQEAASWLTGSTLRQSLGRARAILEHGLEAVVVSIEPTGAELAAGAGKPDMKAGVGRVVAELGRVAREQEQVGAGAGQEGNASTNIYGGNLYMDTSRENRHKLSLMGRSSGVSVATLAARLGVAGRRVREWLNHAEFRGLVVPWRGGAAVPGKGRGRGTVWRLVQTSVEEAVVGQEQQVETVLEATPPPAVGALTVAADLPVVVGVETSGDLPGDVGCATTGVPVGRVSAPAELPRGGPTEAARGGVERVNWTLGRGEPASWDTGRPDPRRRE